jgi:hypothetical protein
VYGYSHTHTHTHTHTHSLTHVQVFIGGTADKDEAELRAHFAQAFGPVADVEVVRERDGAHRGFAFVTFQVCVFLGVRVYRCRCMRIYIQDNKHVDMLCLCTCLLVQTCRYVSYICIYIQDKKHADMLKKQHHTNIGNVRMEAKPCVPPRCAVSLAPPPFPLPPCLSSPPSKRAFRKCC